MLTSKWKEIGHICAGSLGCSCWVHAKDFLKWLLSEVVHSSPFSISFVMRGLMSYIAGRNFTSELREGQGRNKGSAGKLKESSLATCASGCLLWFIGCGHCHLSLNFIAIKLYSAFTSLVKMMKFYKIKHLMFWVWHALRGEPMSSGAAAKNWWFPLECILHWTKAQPCRGGEEPWHGNAAVMW